jgi:Na+/H+ antiporter NhaD/arsenite permease-like protein
VNPRFRRHNGETGVILKHAGTSFIDFIRMQWLPLASGTGLVLTSSFLGRIPVYSVTEMEVLFILAMLFVAVNGLQRSGFIARIAQFEFQLLPAGIRHFPGVEGMGKAS